MSAVEDLVNALQVLGITNLKEETAIAAKKTILKKMKGIGSDMEEMVGYSTQFARLEEIKKEADEAMKAAERDIRHQNINPVGVLGDDISIIDEFNDELDKIQSNDPYSKKINSVYRKLDLKYHPDKTGSSDGFVSLGTVKDGLLEHSSYFSIASKVRECRKKRDIADSELDTHIKQRFKVSGFEGLKEAREKFDKASIAFGNVLHFGQQWLGNVLQDKTHTDRKKLSDYLIDTGLTVEEYHGLEVPAKGMGMPLVWARMQERVHELREKQSEEEEIQEIKAKEYQKNLDDERQKKDAKYVEALDAHELLKQNLNEGNILEVRQMLARIVLVNKQKGKFRDIVGAKEIPDQIQKSTDILKALKDNPKISTVMLLEAIESIEAIKSIEEKVLNSKQSDIGVDVSQDILKSDAEWTKQVHAVADKLVRKKSPFIGRFNNAVRRCESTLSSLMKMTMSTAKKVKIGKEEMDKANKRLKFQVIVNTIKNIKDDLAAGKVNISQTFSVTEGMVFLRKDASDTEAGKIIASAPLDDALMSQFKKLARKIARIDPNEDKGMKSAINEVFDHAGKKYKQTIDDIINGPSIKKTFPK